MSLNDYLKCPGLDRTLSTVPESYVCPDCDSEVEIWSDEKKGRCRKCGKVIRNTNFQTCEELKEEPDFQKDKTGKNLENLKQLACSLGASDAEIIASDVISVENELANRCVEPRCSNYGLAPSCPPHVSGPTGFRKLQETHRHAIVIRIIVPSSAFFSSERIDLGRFLHEIVASIEHAAVEMGYTNSKAFAGGSCKNIFCHDHADCRVLSENGECRYPQHARTSMSGFGVNVFELMEKCGWPVNINTGGAESEADSMSWIAGMVLIG